MKKSYHCRVAGLASVLCLMAGCRAHPISLAITLAGDVVDREDVQAREPLLLGRPSSAADDMFGARHDTLYDRENGGKWLVYCEPGESLAESFYVVQVSPEDEILNLLKAKRNIDGLEDLYKLDEWEPLIVGANRAECESAIQFGESLYHLYSEATGYDTYFYDARNVLHTRGERYCILCFDPDGRCWEARLLGVTAD